jgi:hypothetical protein
MARSVFDDGAVRAAMRSYLAAADGLDELAAVGGEARDVLELAESKAVAGMTLRRALERAGWTAPASAAQAAGSAAAAQPAPA